MHTDRFSGNLPRLQDHVCVMGGRRVHYWILGQGEPLLLLHGLGGSRRAFWPVMEHLARNYRVCAVDAPGHGLSEPMPFPQGPEQYVAFLGKFLDHLGWRSCHMVGNSAGGFMGLLMAILHAPRLRTLTVMDTIVTLEHLPALYAMALVPRVAEIICQWWPKDVSRMLLGHYIRRPERVPYWLIDEILDDFHRARYVCLPMIRSLPGLDLRPYLGLIQTPTLVLWGRYDSLFHVRHAYVLRERIPGARLHIFEQGAHMPFLDNSDEFCGILEDFTAASSADRAIPAA